MKVHQGADAAREERLHVESYVSKERTLGSKVCEGNPFTHSARETVHIFSEMVNTEIRREELIPKIRVVSNPAREPHSESPLKTPTKSQMESQLEAMEDVKQEFLR